MQRPRSVTLVGWLIISYALYLIAVAAIAAAELAVALSHSSQGMAVKLLMVDELSTALWSGQLMLGLVMLISGIGLLQLRSWAWQLALIVQGLGLAVLLVEYVRGTPEYPSMAIGAVLVLLLNQREVQRAMRIAQHRSEPDSIRTKAEDLAAERETQANLTQRG